MLTRYDPERAPDPKRWLAMDEAGRIELARRFHRKARIRVPREDVHAAFHAVVETQVAMGDETPAAATLQRLMAEGLSRHDAVHAIGYVLVGHLHEMLKQEGEVEADPNEEYFRQLRELTADKWLRSADEDETDE
jgi:hypothetical protein